MTTLKSILEDTFGRENPVPIVAETDETSKMFWETWIRTFLADFLDVLPYKRFSLPGDPFGEDFDVREYIKFLITQFLQNDPEDVKTSATQIVDDLITKYTHKSPVIDHTIVKDFLEKESKVNNENKIFFLLYAFHSRRAAGLDEEPFPMWPPLVEAPPSIVNTHKTPEHALPVNVDHIRSRFIKRIETLSHFFISWTEEDTEKALRDIEGDWNLLDPWMKKDLKKFYEYAQQNFKAI